jgi:small neutral amino acid transporter SnatA (MarC family)
VENMGKFRKDLKELGFAAALMMFFLTAAWLLEPIFRKYSGESIIIAGCVFVIFIGIRIKHDSGDKNGQGN